LLVDECPEHSASTGDTTLLNLENYSNLCSFHYLLSKMIISSSEVSAAFSPSLKQNFFQTYCFSALAFPRYAKIMEQHMLKFTETLLNKDTCYSHIPGKK
jgi:hypothetical protein